MERYDHYEYVWTEGEMYFLVFIPNDICNAVTEFCKFLNERFPKYQSFGAYNNVGYGGYRGSTMSNYLLSLDLNVSLLEISIGSKKFPILNSEEILTTSTGKQLKYNECKVDITPIINLIGSKILSIQEKERNELIQKEDEKFKYLYVSGRLGEIGFESSSIIIKEGVIEVVISVPRKSDKTTNKIELSLSKIRKTKKNAAELELPINENTLFDVTFVQDTQNRKTHKATFLKMRFKDVEHLFVGFYNAFGISEIKESTDGT